MAREQWDALPSIIKGGAAPQATGEWETRWGVLAKDKATQTLGVTAGEKSKSAARRTALDNCNKGGQSDVVK